MKKQVSWWILIVGAIVSYVLRAVIGGIIGDAFGLLGFILLLMGVIGGVRELRHKNK